MRVTSATIWRAAWRGKSRVVSCSGPQLGSVAHGAPLTRRKPKTPRKSVRIGALIAEADIKRDIGQRMPGIREQGERGIEPQTLQIAIRRLTERFDEQLMETPYAEAAMRGKIGD